ncbi:hypothetical protein QI059_01025 [Staphylococcus saprophyticus]|nr:hypothetical protein [Staphylococcus saprophyticus]
MDKYMVMEPMSFENETVMPGEVLEIKKLKHPIVFGSEKFKYIEVNKQLPMTKKFIKDNFTKGTYKSGTPKRVLKTLLIISVYELSKYVTNEILIKLSANDEIDQPKDYEVEK